MILRIRHIGNALPLVAVVLVLSVASCPEVREFETPAGLHFSVLTYNVNWGRPSPNAVVRAIREADADIVCLQETTPAWERQLRKELSGSYPEMLFRHWGGAGGLGMLSKSRLKEKAFVRDKAGWFPGWVVVADTPTGSIEVMNLHLRPPLSEAGSPSVGAYFGTRKVRRQEVEDMLQHLSDDIPAVVAGDFNEKESAPAVTWLSEQGMTDALAEFDKKTPTWQWDIASGAVSLKGRYDHILHSQHLHCIRAEVLEVRASDHFPVLAVFQLASDRQN